MYKTLADKALLVRLQRSMYQPYSYDDAATKMVEQATGVRGAGRYNKRLFKGRTLLSDTNEKFNVLYTTFIKNTVPWLDDGVRMVPNAAYFDFAQDLRGLIADARAAADKLAQNWDAMVAADMVRLGALANPADYPSAEEVRARFDARVNFFPIPSTADFRVDVTDEDKAEMEAAIHEAEANVGKHLMKEMLGPVQAFVAKLSVPIGADGSIFRDSLVENVAELVGRLPRLNINADPVIDRMLGDIRTVLDTYGQNPDALRESPIMREAARDKMAQIQSDMAAFMGG